MRKNRDFEDQDQDEEIILVSKSELKRDAHKLRDLGEKLSELKPAQLAKFPLEGRIKDAIAETARIKSMNARKRHLGFVGRLMQEQDVDAIRHQLALLDTSSDEYSCHFHLLERWRENLLKNGNTAITKFMEEFPAADAQHLRQLVRNITRETTEEKKVAQSKKLFRYLREIKEA